MAKQGARAPFSFFVNCGVKYFGARAFGFGGLLLVSVSVEADPALLQYRGYKDTATLPSQNAKPFGKFAVVSTGKGFASYGFTRQFTMRSGDSAVCAQLVGEAPSDGKVLASEVNVLSISDGKKYLVRKEHDAKDFTGPTGKNIFEVKFDAPSTGAYKLECRLYAYQSGLVVYRQLMVIGNTHFYSHVSNGNTVRIASGVLESSGGYSILALNSKGGLASGVEAWINSSGVNSPHQQIWGFGNVSISQQGFFYKAKVAQPGGVPTLYLVKQLPDDSDLFATPEWVISSFKAQSWGPLIRAEIKF